MRTTPLMDNSSLFSKSIPIFLIFGLLIGFSGSAAAADMAEMTKIDVHDRVDRDGDGYISDFSVEIDTSELINERGREDGLGGFGVAPAGEPWFGVYFPAKRFTGDEPDMWAQDVAPVTMNFDYDSVETKGQRSEYQAEYRKYLNGEKPVWSLKVQFLESDTKSGKDVFKDEVIEETSYVFDKPLKIESPENDRSEAVSIQSNPSDAEVYVNGDRKGTTPWDTTMPVDVYDREGALNIRVQKDGYHTLTAQETVYPPEDLEYDLKKVKQPLVVNSNLEDAIVKVNGQKIGETPVSKNYWVKEEVDVTVEKEGYEDYTVSNVKAPRKIDAQFETSSDSSDSTDSGSSLNYDYDLVNSLDYNLVNQLPDLNSLHNTGFNVSQKTVKTGESVTFDASPTYDLAANISSYRWDFGDGSETTGKVESHSYSQPGNYTVNLTVTNSNAVESFSTVYVEVENRLPKPQLSADKNTVKQNQPVKFDATGSNDPEGSITMYEWEIDGQVVNQNQNGEFTHVFTSSGSHEVSVIVTDSEGATATVKKTINVEAPNLKPQADFTVSNANPEVGETVSFDASSSADSDGSISTFAWNFGDGMSKSGEKVQYNYSNAGEYDVELNVLDAANAHASVTKTITVSASQDTDSSSDQSSSEQESQDEQEENSSSTENETSSGEEESSGGLIDQIVRIFSSIF